jgi:hypothetical protein
MMQMIARLRDLEMNEKRGITVSLKSMSADHFGNAEVSD